MRHRGQTTSYQERVEIMEQAATGLNDTQLALAFHCSVWTVRKWRRRALHQGRVGLASHLGRPATGPMSTFPSEVKEAIIELRQLHPGWGPTTLLTALKADHRWQTRPLPSRARIALVLKEAGLTRRYQPHHDLLQPPPVPLVTPHQG